MKDKRPHSDHHSRGSSCVQIHQLVRRLLSVLLRRLSSDLLPPALPHPLPAGMSLSSSLPDVLAQFISHFLTTNERLAMARCSRQNRILAEAPFAWHNADPITIKIDSNGLPSGPLLRFIPVSLVWNGYSTRDSAIGVTSVAGRSNVVALTTRLRGWLDDAPVSEVLEAAGLMRLQSLTLHAHTWRLVELVCKLPLLTSLTLWVPLASADAALLSAAPSLTDVTVSQPDPACLSSVLRCSKLRRLALSGFRWVDFPSFCRESGMQRLRELSLSTRGPGIPSLQRPWMRRSPVCAPFSFSPSTDGSWIWS